MAQLENMHKIIKYCHSRHWYNYILLALYFQYYIYEHWHRMHSKHINLLEWESHTMKVIMLYEKIWSKSYLCSYKNKFYIYHNVHRILKNSRAFCSADCHFSIQAIGFTHQDEYLSLEHELYVHEFFYFSVLLLCPKTVFLFSQPSMINFTQTFSNLCSEVFEQKDLPVNFFQ